ncbi:MAG TPA: bifunctional 5,10-methylene-tetrahydrofolate dehydrogenase/5,10-methylene-tetrahydrofolate cyclohydrolase, partial [Chloroflexota bacterium]|nr:bifunctional 5,10-methylene-tetrahydrofolate dehydrogenase/5,10-methylene-tetrahydrofolate cyclohydrolase [Chloroflexota bacterium]
AKDVDGITNTNAAGVYLGRPARCPSTAAAIMEILDRYEIELTGRDAVVVGRSPVVGKPAAMLLLARHATVTMCHTRTVDLASHTLRADIIIAAAGSPGCIRGSMIKPGAVVVDAGINIVDGKVVGDVDFDEAVHIAGAITPVPGGVGPLTNAILLRSVLENAERIEINLT